MSAINLVAAYAGLTAAVGHIGHYLQAARARLGSIEVEHKSPGDVASAIDREAESMLREQLHALVPQAAFVGEESAGVLTAQLTAQPTWVVDPLDGSANYLRGYPHYAVSVALVVNLEPVLGVVHDPSRNETFSAVQGHGAYVNGAPMRCAARTEPLHCTAATVFPKPHAAYMDEYLAEFARVVKTFGQVRRSGSMALDLAYLAAGRIDAFWARGMGAWDAAAGLILLREAGAQMWAVDGLPLLQSQLLAAATPQATTALQQCLLSNK